MTPLYREVWVYEPDGGMNPSLPFRIKVYDPHPKTSARQYFALVDTEEHARLIVSLPNVLEENKALREVVQDLVNAGSALLRQCEDMTPETPEDCEWTDAEYDVLTTGNRARSLLRGEVIPEAFRRSDDKK